MYCMWSLKMHVYLTTTSLGPYVADTYCLLLAYTVALETIFRHQSVFLYGDLHRPHSQYGERLLDLISFL